MRRLLIIICLFIGLSGYAQTHIEYISEPTDSMALISKKDVDIVNKVFHERSILDSLLNVSEQLVSALEEQNKIQSNIIETQTLIINNKDLVIKDLETKIESNTQYYSKELKKEKTKKISFQTTTGVGIIVIILILLL